MKYSHILAIKVLFLLSYPIHSHSALHFIGNLNLTLSTHGENFTIAEIKIILAYAYQLVLLGLQKQLFLQNLRMLSDLQVALIEVFLGQFIRFSFGQLQKHVVFNVLQLNG